MVKAGSEGNCVEVGEGGGTGVGRVWAAGRGLGRGLVLGPSHVLLLLVVLGLLVLLLLLLLLILLLLVGLLLLLLRFAKSSCYLTEAVLVYA